MEVLNIYLDTSIYMGLNFDFNNKRIKTLKELVEDGLIILYTTSITEREVYNNIKKSVEHSRQYINSLKQEGKLLRNTPQYEHIWDRKTIVNAQVKLEESFKTFLEEAKVQNISINSKGVYEIFDRYFELKAPFSGQKKSEFPDAFVLDSLAEWSKETKQNLYVVSADNDMKNYCEDKANLVSVESLEKMLDIVYHNDDVKYTYVQKIYDDYSDEFIDYMNSSIDQLLFDTYHLFGDVEVKEIKAIEMDEDPLVMSIQDNKVTLVYNAEISYTILVNYLDETLSVYDREAGKYLFTEYDSKTVEDIESIQVEIELDVTNYEEFEFEFDKVIFNKGDTVYIDLSAEYDEF
ncbi:PIN domain-containing protein [Peribacillus sp. NPDC101481]|uniref:PIN domain-containing protein n=1 Tax=Peribacillus sp. NPDC101481 TaxID=3364403 RepID=UPI0037FD1B77